MEIEMRPVVEAAVSIGLAKPGREQAEPEVRTREIVAETIQAARPDIADRLSQARLLWVDDMPQNNRLERRALETFGIEIETSTSTSDAVKKLEAGERFDVIVSDMARPNEPLAGYALLEEKQRIEETDRLEPIPFIIYAGSTTPKYRQEALEKGAFGQTSRPEKLFRMIKEAILERSPP